MLHAACGILAKAAVLLLGLAGTQRRIRLTVTVVLMDVALLPQEALLYREEVLPPIQESILNISASMAKVDYQP